MTIELHTNLRQPWEVPPETRPGRVTVIGGGIAAATLAAALLKRGREVVLIERHPALAQEGSGNPAGIVMPRPAARNDAETRFFARAFRRALATYEELTEDAFSACGVLQLALTGKEERRLAAFLALGLLETAEGRMVGRDEAQGLTGARLPAGGLWSADGGLLRPRRACARLTAGIDRLMLGQEATALSRTATGWRISLANGETLESETVVIASALEAARFEVTAWLPLAARRGQITLTPPGTQSARLQAALVFGGYMTPLVEGRHAVGATFDHSAGGPQTVEAADHRRNLATLSEALGDILPDQPEEALQGRAALRAVTPDHLPLAGPVPDHAGWLEDYAPLAKNAHRGGLPPARWLPGLYVMAGLGPRGLTVAPLLAEMLAGQICGGTEALPGEEQALLQPGRFIIRQLRRQQGAAG
ncbi:FAD-dependent 5-carboxymethylaminomethyl-2-thiouridine(34) oxidoreductase MnmC [Radicibacter daui]|uniref:FAD-dependent 5-carboxymethylaminomethyl-2-thiouridine(34) oxidoreductase MnmC n=1 Tax=Radicibacter daui TaxID=3064829 RepID=UPI00404690DE